MDVGTDREEGVLVVEGSRVRLPAAPWSPTVFGDVAVVWLDVDSPVDGEADVELPAESRNLLAFDRAGRHRWTVDPEPALPTPGHYVRIYRFHGRCICKWYAPRDPPADDDHRLVEVDPETGAVVETFPLDRLRIGGERVQFADDISSLLTFEDVALVVEDTATGLHGNYVNGYDRDGTRLWRRRFESSWLRERDGKLVSMHEPRMGANTDVEHDPRTGEPVAIHRSVFDTRDELETYLPERFHHLIADYL